MSYKSLYFLSAAILLFIALSFNSQAQGNSEIEQIKENLPKLMGANNVGTEFWFTVPPAYEEVYQPDNFIKLYITSPVKTQVIVRVPGRDFFETFQTIANDVVELNISPIVGQVYTLDPQTPPKEEEVFKGYGINVVSEDPIVVYCVVRYIYSSGGFLCIPTSALGKEYIASTYEDMGAMINGNYPSFVGITGVYDNTVLKFTLGGNAQTKTGGGMIPGQTKTAVLHAGDVWMFSSAGDYADLTGSRIVASQPVAVNSGNFCTNIPVGNRWCDYTCEMDVPTFTWGTLYHVPKARNRVYPPIIRVFAKEPATKIYRDGAQVGFISKPGGKIEEGYLEMRLAPKSGAPRSAVISGDKQIGVTFYNCGIQEDSGASAESEPFVMAMSPVEQYQKEITFCVPGTKGGLQYEKNWLNIVYETGENGLAPEHMEYAEEKSGEFVWQELGTKYPEGGEIFKVDYQGKKYAVKTLELGRTGVYKIRSETPFAAYSFGYYYYDSYGYPASAAFIDLTKPDFLAPGPVWEYFCGNVIGDATVTDRPDDDEIRSNLAFIYFNSIESYNYVFDYDDFVPGEDRMTKWRLTLIDKKKDARAVITFSDRCGNDTTVVIEYLAQMDMSPKIIDFGSLKQGESVERSFWVVNRSTTSELEINQTHLKGLSKHFELIGVNLPYIIPADDSVEFKVRFTANEDGGPFVDSILAGHECGSAYFTNVTAWVVKVVSVAEDKDWRSGTFAVGRIVPNPVGAGGAEVTFQVGKEGWTQISIINSLGELVDMPIAGNLSRGEYSFSLPVDKLSSGTYIIELRQDRIVRTQKLIIAK